MSRRTVAEQAWARPNSVKQSLTGAKRRKPLADVRALAKRALEHGAERVSAMTVRWFMAADCEKPYLTEVMARPRKEDEKYVVITKESEHSMCVELWTRCRKCKRCLKARALLWQHRARAETRESVRTWFGTITLKPEAHFLMRSRASKKFGEGFYELPPEKQFGLIHNECGIELTLMMKRIRKNSGASLRFLLVCEAHKSGDPHYHMLIHERVPEQTVTYKVLKAAWVLGFTKWNLTDHTRSGYLTKYLSKDSRARVRASGQYGQLDLSGVESTHGHSEELKF